MKLKSSSSTQGSIIIKTLTRTLLFPYPRRLIKALSQAKSNLVHSLKKNKPINFFFSERKKSNNKTFFGSFRLHYNWCSSRVMNVPENVLEAHLYGDSISNYAVSIDPDVSDDSKLSGYLQWLEDKKVGGNPEPLDIDINDIDKRAEVFIASNYEKFRLEKEDSYRRSLELMERRF